MSSFLIKIYATIFRCVDAIKSSAYSVLAADLEINKAMVFLHNRETQLAIDTLKMFENRDTKANSAAATMLSFIYYLVSNIYKYYADIGLFLASK